MACKYDLTQMIIQEAQSQGVDPGIALRVASQESGICQWKPDGSVIRGAAGEYGVFQLMPGTAKALGVADPSDVTQNIYGGVKYLGQLYTRFGNWPDAIAAYNAGPTAVAQGRIPSSTQQYVQNVLSIAGIYNAMIGKSATAIPGPQVANVGSSGNVPAAPVGWSKLLLFGLLGVGALVILNS